MLRIYEDIVYTTKEGGRYNIILQTHSHINIIFAKLAGYKVTLLYVGAPLETAKMRSRERAIKTGKFLASNLMMQDEVVEDMWTSYKYTAAWHGLWADEFLVADNGRACTSECDAQKYILDHVKEIPLHGCSADWEACMKNAQKAIDATG